MLRLCIFFGRDLKFIDLGAAVSSEEDVRCAAKDLKFARPPKSCAREALQILVRSLRSSTISGSGLMDSWTEVFGPFQSTGSLTSSALQRVHVLPFPS